jgi:hypothetical protein
MLGSTGLDLVRGTLTQPTQRFGYFALLALAVVGAIVCSFKPGGLHLHFDIEQYLDTAYHISHHHVFTDADTTSSAPASIGREPGYPLFLTLLMTLDPQFGRFTPDCLKIDGACDPRIYRSASLANLFFIIAAGAIMYVVALRVCGNVWTGVAAAAYLLFNFQMNKGWADPMSDRLAVLLVCLVLLSVVWAWQGKRTLRWAWVGVALAALTLTKASFFPYCLLMAFGAAGAALFCTVERKRILAALAVAAIVYATLVGGWAARNWTVNGQLRLTDTRGGIALSTREVFDHMTAAQYVASFIYWTRDFGDQLARRLFAPEVVAPFDIDRPGGFYDRGQNGYGERLRDVMQKTGDDEFAATAEVDGELERTILRHPLIHIATTLPLLYRGIWIDEFAVLGFPIFCWICARSIRRRDALATILLSIGVFNLLFYAAFSLDLPRYQMTAVPTFALAAGIALTRFLTMRESRRQRALEKIA